MKMSIAVTGLGTSYTGPAPPLSRVPEWERHDLEPVGFLDPKRKKEGM
jgi:hypothetical protein